MIYDEAAEWNAYWDYVRLKVRDYVVPHIEHIAKLRWPAATRQERNPKPIPYLDEALKKKAAFVFGDIAITYMQPVGNMSRMPISFDEWRRKTRFTAECVEPKIGDYKYML